MVLVAKADIATVMPEPARGAGGSLAPTISGRLVNPIPTRGEQIIPTYYYWPPDFFHLPVPLSNQTRVRKQVCFHHKAVSTKLTVKSSPMV